MKVFYKYGGSKLVDSFEMRSNEIARRLRSPRFYVVRMQGNDGKEENERLAELVKANPDRFGIVKLPGFIHREDLIKAESPRKVGDLWDITSCRSLWVSGDEERATILRSILLETPGLWKAKKLIIRGRVYIWDGWMSNAGHPVEYYKREH